MLQFQITDKQKKMVLEDIPDRYRGFVWKRLIHQLVMRTHETTLKGPDGQLLSYFYEKLALKDERLENSKVSFVSMTCFGVSRVV